MTHARLRAHAGARTHVRAGAQMRVNYVPAMPRQYHGKAGVRGTAPEPVQGPSGEKRAMENAGSERNFGEQLATICQGVLFFSLRVLLLLCRSERQASRTHEDFFQFSGLKRSMRVGQYSAANTRNSGTTYDRQA